MANTRALQGLVFTTAPSRERRCAEALAASWKVPAKYAGYATPQAARLKSNIEVVLKEVK